MGAFPAATGDLPEATGFATEGLTFCAGGRAILRSLDLRLDLPGVSALIGRNGSGKSTLLKLLARQQSPTEGRILFSGRPVEAWRRKDFARTVAYLPQETPQGLSVTVEELVAHGRYPWHGALGRFSTGDREKVLEAMRLTHVDGWAGRFVSTLSGGERQRAWIAMMIAQDARFLLLDEPTSALDMPQQVEILALLRRLSHERGLRVLIVMHDINMAARYCDRLYALKDGTLVAEGAPRDILTPAILHDIYGVGMEVIAHPTDGSPLAYVR